MADERQNTKNKADVAQKCRILFHHFHSREVNFMHPFSNRTYIIEIAYSLAIMQWNNINLIDARFSQISSPLKSIIYKM